MVFEIVGWTKYVFKTTDVNVQKLRIFPILQKNQKKSIFAYLKFWHLLTYYKQNFFETNFLFYMLS